MNKTYQSWTQDQAYLLLPSLRDWLPEDHLAWFVLAVVSQLDLSAIERAIQSKGSRGQHPRAAPESRRRGVYIVRTTRRLAGIM